MRRLRQDRADGDGGWDILGHVHSHPDSPATPSAEDLAMAHDPDMLWLIVRTTAIPTAQAETAAQAWFPDGLGTPRAAFRPLPLRLCDETDPDV